MYLRYHAALKSLTPQQIQHLCTLDYDERMAIAGFVREGETERMVAVGRYNVDRASGFAEVALVVHDDIQGRGIGSYLLKRMIAIARDRGIEGFVGYVLANNVRMLNLFHKCGVPVESTLESGVYTITVRFDRVPEA